MIPIIMKNNKAINLLTNNEDYLEIVEDIVFNPVILTMRKYIQHGTTTCYDHSIYVSYYSYLLAKSLGLDYKSVARAGLLHDLFLYDWHNHNEEDNSFFNKHGFTHPKIAYNNAKEIFNLNEIEKDCILKHMWPLTFTSIPSYKEAYVLSFVDKISSVAETFRGFKTIRLYLKNIVRYI